ncbi:MAG: septum formation initiator family protein [Prevotella sp.]|nr:septum formation initiator family protein [Prevotella sp.]
MRLGKKILWIIGKFKYVIVIIGGVLIITVLGENSMMQRYKYARQIAELEDEIEKQDMRFMQDSLRLEEMDRNPEEVRRIARERYFMKASDEDIYVLSDEIKDKNDYAPVKQD